MGPTERTPHIGRQNHGRQDTKATTEDQEAEAAVSAADQGRVVASEPKRTRAVSPGHRFKRREIDLVEGGKLALHTDGSISQIDGQGEVVKKWVSDDPEWPRHAIRFGLLLQPATHTPPDTRVRAPKTVA